MMIKLPKVLPPLAAMLLLFGLAGCEEGGLENAGEEIGQGVEDAGEGIGEAGERAGEAIER